MKASRSYEAPLLCAALAFAGCASSHEPPPDLMLLVVGPSPLRRLSNGEYRNALHDLFPGQARSLPKLPDDASTSGFENALEAQQPSDVRVARYEAIANLYAEGATGDVSAVRSVVGCADWATPSAADACLTQLPDGMGRRVFRRPLEAEERERFTRRFGEWRAAIDFEAAVRLTLMTMLQSPQFLHRAEAPPSGAGAASESIPVEPYAMASRLSFFLWESIPDDRLLEAASRDELRTPDQLRAQAARMLQDDRARRVLWSFHRQWLGLDRVLGEEHILRSPEVDPWWTAASQTAASRESQLFVENILMEDGTLRDLLLSPRAWVNGEMARVYGAEAPRDPATWREVTLPGTERAGILTRGAAPCPASRTRVPATTASS